MGSQEGHAMSLTFAVFAVLLHEVVRSYRELDPQKGEAQSGVARECFMYWKCYQNLAVSD